MAKLTKKKKDAAAVAETGARLGGDDIIPPTLSENLPSEQDRKAIMGCLAAVLNNMFGARQRVHDIVAATPTATVASGSSSHGGSGTSLSKMGEGEELLKVKESASGDGDGDGDTEIVAVDDAVNFSIRDDEKHVDKSAAPKSSMFTSKTAQQQQQLQQQAMMRRTKAFQRELLNLSAELLFLPTDHAAIFLPNLDIQCEDDKAEQEMLLNPFLNSLSSSEESFRCIALLMFRFLLSSGEEETSKQMDCKKESDSMLEKMTIVGYDARVRFAFKYLAVSVLSYWDLKDHGEFVTEEVAAACATRKFEALEDGIALKLSILSQIMQAEKKGKGPLAGQKQQQSTFTKNAVRGLKIGAAGVAAGTVFAITGGLAAPAIIGGIAALTGASSVVTVIATVLLLPAATTIFGVGGGTLVASKMSKRTAGLTDFSFEKVTGPNGNNNSKDDHSGASDDSPELSRTVCISGWAKDEHDFERPFGIQPRALSDRHELLCRYCSVYAPQLTPADCRKILDEWKGKEDELWDMCKESYGKDPSSLLPFEKGPRYDALLDGKENEAVDNFIRAMGLPFPKQEKTDKSPAETSGELAKNQPPRVDLFTEVLLPTIAKDSGKKKSIIGKDTETLTKPYKAWDFQSEYGSELYIIQWEKELLKELYGSARDFQKGLVKKAGKEALKKTAMATLMAAVAVPSFFMGLADIIDERWTLVREKSDEAGILLAQSLLDSNAGHRPVSLIGFSFGARIIVACMKELARNQAIWELQQEQKEQKDESASDQSMAASVRKSVSNMSMKSKLKEAQQIHYSREPASIIEDVILMGSPTSVNASTWLSIRQITGGRLVNCYSRNDMILALMYRVKNVSEIMSPPVGICAVKNVPGIENYDVSGYVSSHGDYGITVREILELVGYNQPTKLRKAPTCSAVIDEQQIIVHGET